MLFNSWSFVCLVIITMIIYYLPLVRNYQIYVLLIASFSFYGYGHSELLSILVISSLLNALASYGTLYTAHARFFSTLGVILNLLILILFKYNHLIANLLVGQDSGIGQILCILPLPIGISFFTFSGISLTVDAYKGHISKKKEKHTLVNHLKRTFLYICFFPKLLSGPIAKSNEFMGEIDTKFFRDINWEKVFKSLVVGYFLKMVIADNLKDFTFWMSYRYCEHMGSGSLLLMLFGYSFQMFADFAGYSLIAIGIARLFGYNLPDNFNFPYISSTFRDFWKRWHITLSRFLMEYLYISLGGNRKGKIRTYINLMLTMMLGGFWHGAAWSYLVWGTYHGLCLVMERLFCGKRENIIDLPNTFRWLSQSLSIILVFVTVSFGWLLFRLPINEAFHYTIAIFTNINNDMLFEARLLPIILYIFPIIVYHIIYFFHETFWVKKYVLRFDFMIYGIMLFLILTNSGSSSSFVYFQF